jgi:hypothetical protein
MMCRDENGKDVLWSQLVVFLAGSMEGCLLHRGLRSVSSHGTPRFLEASMNSHLPVSTSNHTGTLSAIPSLYTNLRVCDESHLLSSLCRRSENSVPLKTLAYRRTSSE